MICKAGWAGAEEGLGVCVCVCVCVCVLVCKSPAYTNLVASQSGVRCRAGGERAWDLVAAMAGFPAQLCPLSVVWPLVICCLSQTSVFASE